MKKFLTLLAAALISAAAFSQRKSNFDGQYYQDVPSSDWELKVADRIELMGNIEWTTLAPMPKCFKVKEAMFEEGETRKGIPYSAVHDWCGYVGKDISFFTFLSAVNNRYGSMYSVNYHLEPWDRAKSGPFYGTVCTATANYVLGIPMMMFCRFIRRSETVLYEDLGNDIDTLQLYDAICWSGTGGHIMIICGIGRDESGSVRQIKTFEGTGPVNRFKTFTREDFIERLVTKWDAHFFRYDHEKWAGKIALPEYIEQASGFDCNFNKDLAPEDGERLSFPEGKAIRIDIFSDKYKTLEVYLNGKLHSRQNVSGPNVVTLEGLPRGLYTARLVKGKKASRPIEFQVAPRSCKAWYEDGQLYVGGCEDGVYPIGAYVAIGDKLNKKYSSFPIAQSCIKVAEDKWMVVPNVPQGKYHMLKVNLAAKYSGYWADIIQLP